MALGEKAQKFTNVFVKNFGDEVDDDKLRDMFENYGKITSHKVMSLPDGKGKGFGFVCFENPEDADKVMTKAVIESILMTRMPTASSLLGGLERGWMGRWRADRNVVCVYARVRVCVCSRVCV